MANRLNAVLFSTSALGVILSATFAAAEPAKEGGHVVLDTLEVEGVGETATGPVDSYVATRSASGTKTDTPLKETPQSISVISAEEIEAQNPQALGAALRYTPGVRGETFGFEPRMTFIRMRGFDVTVDGLYKDGMKLPNPGYAIGYSLEPYGAERIEVPRGPASVLYGQAAPGGLVNYISKRPLFERFGEVEVEFGNYDRKQLNFDGGDVLNEDGTLAFRVTGVLRDSDTQVDYIPDDRIYIAPSLAWQPNEDTSLILTGHYQKDETMPSQRYPAAGTLDSNPNGKIPVNRFGGEPDVDRYNREDYSVSSFLEHSVSDAWTVRQNARYFHSRLDNRNIYPTALQADNRTVSRTYYENFGDMGTFTVDNQSEHKFETGGVKHTLLAGLDYQLIEASSRRTSGPAPDLDIFDPVYGAPVVAGGLIRDNDQTQQQIGLYLQDQMKIADKVIVQLGGRQDWAETDTNDKLGGTNTTQKDDAFTGRAGVAYLFDNGWTPYLSYAESFLPSLGTDPSGNTFEPETAVQYEAGIKYQPRGFNSFITLAYFDLTRVNFITSDPVTFASVQRGEAQAKGVEVQGLADLGMGPSLNASYTYLDAEVTKSSIAAEVGEPLDYSSEHQGSLWADYRFSGDMLDGLSLGGGVRYIGPSAASYFAAYNAERTPSVTLFDASLRYALNENVEFALNGQNIFDKEYVASIFSNGAFATYGEARVVTGSIKYKF